MALPKYGDVPADERRFLRPEELPDQQWKIAFGSPRQDPGPVQEQQRREDQELIERDILMEERERSADLRDDLLYEREIALQERERRAALWELDLGERQRQQDRRQDRQPH